MKRLTGLLLGVAVAALVGCGDNNKECGDGTHVEEGYCVPDDTITPPNCGDGTILHEDTNTCVIDPEACQAGTVLVDGQCIDMAEDVVVDLAEGAEPNALGFFGEDSDEPAGVFEIKPIGGVTVISGVINPHPDTNEDSRLEPDADTYFFDATGPMLLELSVDGTAGIAGTFIVLGVPQTDDDPLIEYARFGVNMTGDTAVRQLFLPQAGVYALVVVDRRTYEFGDGVGGEDGKYFVSVAQKEITPTPLTLTDGESEVIGTIADIEVDFYSTSWGTGLSQVQLDAYDDDFFGELVVSSGGGLRGTDINAPDLTGLDADPASGQANLVFAASGQTYVAVDYAINTSAAAVDYRFRARTTSAVAVDRSGGDASVTSPTDEPGDALGGFNVLDQGYFSVGATANEYLGADLSFDTLVSAELFDANGRSVATFTDLDPLNAFEEYVGLLRLAQTGTYYLAVFAPADAPGTDVTLTSTFAPVTAADLTFDQAVTDVAPNEFNSNVFTYAAGTEPWQLASVTANAASGGATVRFIAVDNAYGMLDNLEAVTNVDADPAGVAITAGENSTSSGGILPPKLGSLIAIVNTGNAAGTFDLATEARDYTDEGEQDAGYLNSLTNQTIPNLATVATDEVRYLIKTDPDNTVVFSADPQATLDIAVRCVNGGEGTVPSEEADDGSVGDAESIECAPDRSGYVAFEVAAVGVVLGNFILDIEVIGPRTTADGFYTFSAGTTQWMNICSLPTADVTPLNRDDGLTSTITLPGGFDFYGVNVTEFVASTNGWISFDTTTTDPAYWLFDTIPTFFLPDTTIAPFWGDLVGVRLCTQHMGNKQFVQWRGTDLYTDEDASMMLVLDAATDTIEFVYPPFFNGLGGSIGVQETSSEGQEYILTDDLGGTSLLLTPM